VHCIDEPGDISSARKGAVNMFRLLSVIFCGNIIFSWQVWLLGEFQVGIKKFHPTLKHGSKIRPRSQSFSYGLRCHCVWGEHGFGAFLDLLEKAFFLI
jgi:hypothetical protein